MANHMELRNTVGTSETQISNIQYIVIYFENVLYLSLSLNYAKISLFLFLFPAN